MLQTLVYQFSSHLPLYMHGSHAMDQVPTQQQK